MQMTMNATKFRQWGLIGVSAVLASIAAMFLLGVLERLTSAAWMAYKFHGYSDQGFITLNKTTAYLYVSVAVLLLVVSWWLAAVAKRAHSRPALLMSRGAAVAFLVGITLYVVLGLSDWNQWR